MTEEAIALAEEIAKAYKNSAQIHMKETKAYIKQHRTYNSKTDYDKAHTKTIAQMVAEHLISLGYHRDNVVGVDVPDDPLLDDHDTL